MGKSYIVAEELLTFAHQTIEETSSIEDYKRALCVALGSDCRLTTDEISNLLRIGRRTVFRYRDEFSDIFKGNEDPRLKWSGRRNSLLTESQEKKFLESWKDKAIKGELIDAKLIHASLTDFIGHPISLASTYNLLQRHGWRKLAPDTCHPKSNPAVQDDFKKKSQKYWYPPSSQAI